jgi:hypothetical protein
VIEAEMPARHVQTERFVSFGIDYQREVGRLLDRKVSSRPPLKPAPRRPGTARIFDAIVIF